MESSRINTTNYISSNMAEEEYKTLRKLILNDFCLILLNNVNFNIDINNFLD